MDRRHPLVVRGHPSRVVAQRPLQHRFVARWPLGGLDGVSEDLGDGDDVLTVADQVRAGGVRFPQLRSLLGHVRPNFPEYYGDLFRIGEVVDQKPPRLAGGERETLHALLRYQRESLVRKVSGAGEVDARRQFVASGTTLLWLIKHMARAEILWVLHRFAGEAAPVPDDTVHPGDALPATVEAYRAAWAQVDAVVSAASSLDQLCRRNDGQEPVNLRWVLSHLLEETARHAGHADVIRELIDGQTGR